MNQTIETILTRRSVRFFTPRPVDKKDINEIIRAGNFAPSGAGIQSWRFVVIQDKVSINKLAGLALPRYKKWMESAPDFLKTLRQQIDSLTTDPVYYNAPLIIFVIGVGQTSDFDCSMVCQNMMLAARALEIGSCWVQFGQLVIDDLEVSKMLEIKDGEKVYGPIIFGYPSGTFPPSPPKSEPVVKII